MIVIEHVKNRLPLFILLSFFGGIDAIAQEEDLGTEVVNIVKPYSPTVSDAFKIKETPVLGDSLLTSKRKLNYQINSVPVASTFTPSKGKAAHVKKVKPIKQYGNYASLGLGNYTTILGEFFSDFQVSRTDSFGLFFMHNSSQGGIDDVQLEHSFYDTGLEGNYTSRTKESTFMVNVGVKHQIFNWYGLNEKFDSVNGEQIDAIDPRQSYTSGYVKGLIDQKDSFFDKLSLQVRYLSDDFSSSEIHARVIPEFSIPLTSIDLDIDGTVDFVTGGFDRDYFNSNNLDYGFLIAELSPSFDLINQDLTLKIGASGTVLMDSDKNDTKLYIYPKINASYRIMGDHVILYGGLVGGLSQNSYYQFKEENPYISPTLNIKPTSKPYSLFAGIRGAISNKIGYNLKASYTKEEDKPLLVLNTFKGTGEQEFGYEYGNSFNVVYDDINTVLFFAAMNIEASKSFSLGINGMLISYETVSTDEAWNLPSIQASVFSNFNITEEIYGGISFFFVGERHELFVSEGGPLSFPVSEKVTLDGYFDANAHVGYRFNEQLNFFIKGSNLLGENYEKWLNYPVLGLQGLFGATYKFDW